MKSFVTDLGDISLDVGEIYRTMGSGDYRPDGDMQSRVAAAIDEVSSFCRPRYGYEILPVQAVTDTYICMEGRKLATGRIITPFFRHAQFFAVFVATVGPEFDEWMKEIKAGGDILAEFIGDALGSEIAEAAAREMAGRLESGALEYGMGISNSYSPGYCGWNIRQQRALFGLLPPSPCGITLTDSCLMLPIKSVSGVIGIGSDMRKMAYSCEICDRPNCYKKRTG